jgi:hypothetical protein
VMHHVRWWPYFRYVILPAESATYESDKVSRQRANHQRTGAMGATASQTGD